MIRSLLFILALALGLIAAPYWSGRTGLVTIQLAGYTIEMSVLVAVLLIGIAFFIGLFIFLGLKQLFLGKRKLFHWQQVRQQSAAKKDLQQAWLAWLQLDFEQAQAFSVRSKKHHPDPELADLIAASAQLHTAPELSFQQHVGKHYSFSSYQKQLAVYSFLSAQTPAQAQIAFQTGSLPQSLPKKSTDALLKHIAIQLETHQLWKEARDFLEQLDKNQVALPYLFPLIRKSYQDFFCSMATLHELQATWQDLHRSQKRQSAIALAYANTLHINHYHQALAEFALHALKKDILTVQLLLPLAPTQWANTPQLLQWSEKQAHAHQNSVEYLIFLACCAFAQQHLEQAEQAVQQGLELQPLPTLYQLQGDIYLAKNDHTQALSAYQRACSLTAIT